MTTLHELGKRWRAARLTTRYSQSEAAAHVELHPRDLQRVEAGKCVPSSTMVIAYSTLYGVPERDLLG